MTEDASTIGRGPEVSLDGAPGSDAANKGRDASILAAVLEALNTSAQVSGRYIVPRVRARLYGKHPDVQVADVRAAVEEGLRAGALSVTHGIPARPFAEWNIARSEVRPRVTPARTDSIAPGVPESADEATAISETVFALIRKMRRVHGRFLTVRVRTELRDSFSNLDPESVRDAVALAERRGLASVDRFGRDDFDEWVITSLSPAQEAPASDPTVGATTRHEQDVAPVGARPSGPSTVERDPSERPDIATDRQLRRLSLRVVAATQQRLDSSTVAKRVLESLHDSALAASPEAVSRTVQQLVERGLVERVPPRSGAARPAASRALDPIEAPAGSRSGPGLHEQARVPARESPDRVGSGASMLGAAAVAESGLDDLIVRRLREAKFAFGGALVAALRHDGTSVAASLPEHEIESAIVRLAAAEVIASTPEDTRPFDVRLFVDAGLTSAGDAPRARSGPRAQAPAEAHSQAASPRYPSTPRSPHPPTSSAERTRILAIVRSKGPMLGRHLVSEFRRQESASGGEVPRQRVEAVVASLLASGLLSVDRQTSHLDFGLWTIHASGKPAVRVRRREGRSLRHVPASEVQALLRQLLGPGRGSDAQSRIAVRRAIVNWYECRDSEEAIIDSLLDTEWSGVLP